MTRTLLSAGYRELNERELAGRLCRACVDGLAVDGAAVSLLTGSEHRVTLAATDPVAQLLEELQFTLNEGACMEAARSGRPVLVPDLHDTARTAEWPAFASAVLERTAVAAVFALPLQWGAATLGVLDLYRLTPGRLADEQWHDAAAAADTTTLMMLGRRTHPTPDHPDSAGQPGAGPGGTTAAATADTADDAHGDGADGNATRGDGAGDWLAQVSGYRAEIHQAVGMVQVQLELSGVDALARMRSYAFAHQRLLLDVAHDVVARRLVFTDTMP